MAQAFISTYKNSYRWNDLAKSPPNKSYKNNLNEVFDDGNWLQVEDFEHAPIESLTAGQEAIKKLHNKRMWSTYQIHYCKNESKQKKETSANYVEFQDELLTYCENLYTRRDHKVLPPVSTARSVVGYIRPKRLYTPLTNYQKDYGLVGYQMLVGSHVPVIKYDYKDEDFTTVEESKKDSAPATKTRRNVSK